MKNKILIYLYIFLIIYIIIKSLLINLYYFVLSICYYIKIKLIYYYKFSFLTKKDYEEDFEYLIKFLKENSPYAFKINFDKLEKQKDNICNCKDIKQFYYNIMNQQDLSYNNIGHFNADYPIDFFVNIDNSDDIINKSNIPLYFNLREYNSNDFLKGFDYFYNLMTLYEIYQNIKYNKNISSQKKLFKYKLIKNNKNDISIYIKIKKMFYPYTQNFSNNYLKLKDFIKKYNYVKNVYIDVRNNSGGYQDCSLLILNLFYKDYKKTNLYKTYIKYTNYNKLNYKLMFSNKNVINKYSLIKLSNNDKFTHLFYYSINPSWFSDNDNIIYNGHINLIINDKCTSACQFLIDIFKNCKNCTIYGDNPSKGFGVIDFGTNITSLYFALPKTKLIFRYETIYVDDEFSHTEPDYKIPDFLKTKEIFEF